jgi:hypothetical protein
MKPFFSGFPPAKRSTFVPFAPRSGRFSLPYGFPKPLSVALGSLDHATAQRGWRRQQIVSAAVKEIYGVRDDLRAGLEGLGQSVKTPSFKRKTLRLSLLSSQLLWKDGRCQVR